MDILLSLESQIKEARKNGHLTNAFYTFVIVDSASQPEVPIYFNIVNALYIYL